MTMSGPTAAIALTWPSITCGVFAATVPLTSTDCATLAACAAGGTSVAATTAVTTAVPMIND